MSVTLSYQDLRIIQLTDESLLAKAYLAMDRDGTLGTVFYQGKPTVSSFIKGCLDPGTVTLGAFRLVDDIAEFCGIGWVMNATRMNGLIKAECGTCYFKKQSNRKNNVVFGRLMLQAFFENFDIDVIFGTTPEPNRLAIAYAQKLGFSMHGPIPDFATWNGELAPAWISHMNKTEWLERNK
jgi:hypothetical protein